MIFAERERERRSVYNKNKTQYTAFLSCAEYNYFPYFSNSRSIAFGQSCGFLSFPETINNL